MQDNDLGTQKDFQALIQKQTLGLRCVVNARQLGGYETFDGRRVRNLALLRSGQLDMADKQDIAFLKDQCHLTQIIDFRDITEVEHVPPLKFDGVQYHNLYVLPPNFVERNITSHRAGNLTEITGPYSDQQLNIVRSIDYEALWECFYDTLATSETSAEAFKNFFNILLENRDGAILFHCASGKDRTGVATILLLHALGVDYNTIERDYLLTNSFLENQIQAALDSARRETDDEFLLRGVALLEGVERHFFDRYLSELDKVYGGIDNYLSVKIGVGYTQIAYLKDKYTV